MCDPRSRVVGGGGSKVPCLNFRRRALGEPPTQRPPNRSPNPGERPKPPSIPAAEHRLAPQSLRSHALSGSPTAEHPNAHRRAKPREPTPFPRSPPPIPQNDISPAVKQRGRRLQFLQAPAVGFEPTTRRLTVACSTTELSRNFTHHFRDGSARIDHEAKSRQHLFPLPPCKELRFNRSPAPKAPPRPQRSRFRRLE